VIISSCEDPIEVELAEHNDQVVIDAWLSDLVDTDQVIRLSYSNPYFDSLSQRDILEAVISLRSDSGNEYTFDFEDGVYKLNELDLWYGEPLGATFSLTVGIGDDIYLSETTKNPVPPVDSISQELRVGEAFIEDGYYCNFFATDLSGIGNTYWIKTYKNGVFLNRPTEINLAYDAGFDPGFIVDNLVFIQPIQEIINPVDDNFQSIPYEVGDHIRVEIHSISNEAFDYMELLRDQLLNSNNGIFAEPLANTKGNVATAEGKEALGFFNIASVSVGEREIEE